MHNGFTRAYLLSVPSTYDGSVPYPLIFVFHGQGGSDSALYKSGFNERSEIMNYIMVYPSGINKSWNGPDNDVDFISTLIDTLGSKFNIDSKRIYATGHSAGAFFCYKLGVELSNRIAAIAPVAGFSTATSQTIPAPLPVLAIHAVDDPTVSYSADQAGLSAWRTVNQCSPAPDTVYNYNGAIGQVWTAKETGADVSFYTYTRGGHTWLNYPIGCTDLIVNFFFNHPARGMKVTVTSPNDIIFNAPATIQLTANIESALPVTKVEYFTGSTKIGESLVPPYSITWSNVTQGEYIVHAKTTVEDGTSEISSNIKPIEVLLPNVAIHKIVKCLTTESSTTAAQNAFDGDFMTRWSSVRSDPQWILVDLQETYRINSITLFWNTSYGLNYSLDVSLDSTNWMTVYTTTSGNGGAEYISISPVETRYVRMFGNKRGTPYSYSLWEFQIHGEKITDVKSEGEQGHPRAFALSQNFPNPFNPSTVIHYRLPDKAFVSLKIYDLLGREIKTLIQEPQNGGSHSITFSANGLTSGVYFYRLYAVPTVGRDGGSFIDTKKCIFLQ